MKESILTIFAYSAFCILHSAFAQAPSIQWSKCYGGTISEKAFCTHQTTDGGFIMAGQAGSNDSDVSGHHGPSSPDYWIVKTDSIGTLQWQKCLGGSGTDIAYSIVQTTNGGYIVTGVTDSQDGDVTINYGSVDCWVVKLDSGGNIEWQKSYGGIGSDEGHSVLQAADSGYIIAGTYDDSSSGFDYWVIKFDSIGTIEWQNFYGSNGWEDAWDIHQTLDHGYVIAGTSYSNDTNVIGNNGYEDCWILKIDSIGAVEWEKNYGSSESDYCYSVSQTRDSGYIFIAQPTWNDSDVSCTRWHDYWLVKLDATGNMQWQQCFGGSNIDDGYCVRQTNDFGYIITGNATSLDGDVTGNHVNDYWVVKTDSMGTFEWQKCFGGSWADVAYSIEQTSDSGYIVGGSARSNDGDVSGNNSNTNVEDFWLVKLAPPLGTTVQHQNEETFSIYPNPVKEILQLSVGNKIDATFRIFNLMGEEVLQTETQTARTILDVHNLAVGMYFITVQTKVGMVTEKFVKE